MRILMFHMRAAGHNIHPFLEYFDESGEHELTFIYARDRNYESSKIHFSKLNVYNPLSLLRNWFLLRKEYDLIWFHGGHNAWIFLFFILFRPRNTTFIFNVWNEWLIRRAANSRNVRDRIFRYCVRQSDVIHCNWYGTADLIEKYRWNENVRVFPWGLHKDYFTKDSAPLQPVTRQFLQSLPDDKYKFFFPKSISPSGRHDLVIEACEELLEQNVRDFIVYFWIGNHVYPSLLEQYKAAITEKGLHTHIRIVRMPFLPFSDMCAIWKKMDCGLQIAADEQFSTTFQEPLYFKKEIVVSDILPYRIFNDKFGQLVELTPLTGEAISGTMRDYIQGKSTPSVILEKRKKLIEEHFNLSGNIGKIVEYYHGTAGKN